jgi:hypothetical protein
MSEIPGYTLESFLLWNFDLVAEGHDEADLSLGLAEMLGTIPLRPRLSQERFAKIVADFEPHRERVEESLRDYDPDHSWRDYASYAFDWLPRYSIDTGEFQT